jgi:ABC-type sugar transport system ATPase subunit
MLAVQGVSKTFGPALVLDNVDMSVPGGTVHALLGANGAGKSTLMKCIAGAIAPDAGRIVIDGTVRSSLTPESSHRLGVASVFQHLSLISTLSVAENIFLGAEERRLGLVVDRRTQNRKAAGILATLGEDIDPSVRVEDLSADRRQMVEIAKALAKSPKVLILDEPTAALSQSEIDRLFAVIRELKRSGIAIIYISHRIPEIFEIADAVTVLRDGSVVLQGAVASMVAQEVVQAIVGRDRKGTKATTERREAAPPAVVADGIDCGLAEPVSIAVHPGEIVGLYGLKGSGRETLVSALAGARRIRHGTLSVNGLPQRFADPADAIACGICLVPGDRHRRGLFGTMPTFDNVLLPHLARLGWGPLRAPSRERSLFANVVKALGVLPPSPHATTRNLSGGNQQKLLLGRWISHPSALSLLLLEEPTEGVDAGARADLYANLRTAVAAHSFGILWSSSDLEELVGMADRVLVMASGRIVGELSGGRITAEAILSAAQDI